MSRDVFLHSVIVSVSKTAAYSEPFPVSEQLEGRKGFILLSILLCKHVKGRVCKIGEEIQYICGYGIRMAGSFSYSPLQPAITMALTAASTAHMSPSCMEKLGGGDLGKMSSLQI
jgi:hypothetical protein